MRLLKRQRQLATLGRALILPRHRPTFGPRLNWTYSAFPIGLGLVILVTGIAFLSRIGLGGFPATSCSRVPPVPVRSARGRVLRVRGDQGPCMDGARGARGI
jgi:hypothetical protein